MRAARRALAAVAVAAALLTGTAGCALLGGNSSVPVATAKPPTGTDGAVDFDGRFLAAGSGEKTVDIWFDAMCPVCGAFEKANGDTLANAVNDGEVTLRLHPLTFLDRASNGTGYSTRAAAALVCVGVHDSTRVLDYYQALFTDQPEEGSNGLTDEQLAKRASDLGIADISGCLDRSGPYQAWAQANTAQSQEGPIEVDGTKVLDRIEGTPTVLVNGKQYTGSISDAKKFEDFLSSH
ncbi:thioredoxin domain-containing protein [Leifsonia sp. F6_8S_P_1B]|uniref:Thioredoxin domain-containing protein n=1 Tax=Leifsonia williamsii TaxID=3035919 RepID=A0ABT8KDD0_9MICO|nr:thioredoxin domain-containing protein [Leifsonia williamsii]MDN4615469.1 thioredoxin domain-containing protein [Leifsonia williamsii]